MTSRGNIVLQLALNKDSATASENDHSDASYDNLFEDNSSDEYVPDPKDYVDSSDDGIAEEQNEPKTKKRCHRIMREKIDNEMMDVQSNDELIEEQNNSIIEQMDDDNVLKGTVVHLLAAIENDLVHGTNRNLAVSPMNQLLLTLRLYATKSSTCRWFTL
ncbi:hypothetical protein RN001_002530 [Aquatica leii]|uniref:Uncharacterized protein n=1 Tax=Aquatica leii TaxID=1421715 RepID=A0AAN7SLV7_9COLE|nr:hypothetical protein RN001_002530 [Aquatica leii]